MRWTSRFGSTSPWCTSPPAFVAGNRSGLVFEDEEIVGYFPKRDELGGRDFSLQRELQDCRDEVARLRSKADDAALTAVFRKRAIERLEQEGRDPREEKSLRLAVGRERKLWLTQKLVDAGMERARQWGWPNTYTYTKALGEQVMASTPELRYAIVRPSIVESALRYPFPGWNEGFTTSAPLAYAGLKGQRALPTGERTILDIVPVDLVAASLIAITAHTLNDPRATRLPPGLGRRESALRRALLGAGGPLPTPLLQEQDDGQQAVERSAEPPRAERRQ